MPKLPAITATEAIAAFAKAGFVVDRQTGSHVIMKRAGWRFNLSIPSHGNKMVKPGLLRSQITAAGLTVEQFIELLS